MDQNTIITCSVDQRVTVWRSSGDHDTHDRVSPWRWEAGYYSNIADISSMDTWMNRFVSKGTLNLVDPTCCLNSLNLLKSEKA